MKRVFAALSCALFACLFVLNAYADGDSRPATSEEQAYVGKLVERFKSAVSGFRTEWTKTDEGGLSVPERVSVGNEEQPMAHYVNTRWADTKRIEEAEMRIGESLPTLYDTSTVANADEAMKKIEKMAEQLGAAIAAGDMTKVETLQKEMEKISAAMESQFSKSDERFTAELEKLLPKDSDIRLRVAFNSFNVSFSGVPDKGKLKSGITCYRMGNGEMMGEAWVEGVTYVVLGGDWETITEEGYSRMEMTPDSEKSHLAVQSVVIEVQAEKARAESVLNQMKLDELATLIEK